MGGSGESEERDNPEHCQNGWFGERLVLERSCPRSGMRQQHVPSAPFLEVQNCAHFRARRTMAAHGIIPAQRIHAAP